MSERGCLCRAHNSQHTYCYESCGQAGCTLNAGSFESRAGSSVPEAARADQLRCRQCGTWNYPSSAMVLTAAADTAAAVAAAVAEERARVRQGQPPDGWLQMGTCVDWPWLTLEFSEELDDCGLPLWERPVDSSAEERATTGRCIEAAIREHNWNGRRLQCTCRKQPVGVSFIDHQIAAVRAAPASPGEGE